MRVAPDAKLDPTAHWPEFRNELDKIVESAEARFGSSLPGRVIREVLFDSNGRLECLVSGNSAVTLYIGQATTDQPAIIYHTAHELFHGLSMIDARRTYLEEGLAVSFGQDESYNRFKPRFYELPDLGGTDGNKYVEARERTRELLHLNSDVVKTVRKTQPVVSKISAGQITSACPSCPTTLASILASPFDA
jgi:hypothetical protein